jgi:hypothetical protein
VGIVAPFKMSMSKRDAWDAVSKVAQRLTRIHIPLS